MRKRTIVITFCLVILIMPALSFSQSMGGNRHGMMGQSTPGTMGESSNVQGGAHIPYNGFIGECGMWGPMMGYGMGGGMMHGPGMGNMNHPMMGGYGIGMHGMRMGGAYDWSRDEMNTFLEETRGLRKQMHDLRFEYGEKKRNPQTTIGELQQMQDKLVDLQKQLWERYSR